MAVYNSNGQNITTVYDYQRTSLAQAYDVDGNELLSGGGGEWVKTILPYNTNYIIDNAWLTNATTQRDALLTAFQSSNDAIPFFIQTDGHGRTDDGNKGCHNLAEPIMKYIRNIQLGDYGSYYSDGANPRSHANNSVGIEKYISAMGNHEFLNNNSETAELADLSVLVPSYTPQGGILGSAEYGCYKVLDDDYNVKYLVTQPHIPDASDSKGFRWEITSEQYDWLIDELGANDGYDIVVIQHEAPNGTYVNTADNSTFSYNFANMNISPILQARKSKSSGTYTHPNGDIYDYDFTNCTSDLLCVLSGHHHKEAYMTKTALGFPIYVADWFGRNYTCNYGLIDREHHKLKIWKFSKSAVAEMLELDL